jgi:hypothetical protein
VGCGGKEDREGLGVIAELAFAQALQLRCIIIGSKVWIMFSSRRSVASLCLAFVLLAGLLPVCGVFSILLIPLFLFSIALVTVPLHRDTESCTVQPVPCLTLFPSRAPPSE